ncbi:MAG: hypothetical protein ACREQV_08120, partial [Candidatus Binatia bacterium]
MSPGRRLERTGLSKLFMGSVAGKIVSLATYPVLTVRGNKYMTGKYLLKDFIADLEQITSEATA